MEMHLYSQDKSNNQINRILWVTLWAVILGCAAVAVADPIVDALTKNCSLFILSTAAHHAAMWAMIVIPFFLPLLVASDDVYKSDAFTRADVIVDLITFLEWTDAVFVYDESMSITQRHNLMSSLADVHIGVVSLEIDSTSQNDAITSVISSIQSTTISSIVVCVQSDFTELFLKKAQAASMFSEKYEWLVLCAASELGAIERLLCCVPSNVALLLPVMTSAAFSASLDATFNATNDASTIPGVCSPLNITMGVRSANVSRLPPPGWDSFCVRSYSSRTSSLEHVASWTPQTGLKAFRDVFLGDHFRRFNNITLRVGAWQSEPFTIRNYVNGTIKYTGFCLLILEDLARHLNFNYEVMEPADGQYGAPLDENGTTWSGMVGMIMRGELDLAVGPFTITPLRLSVVDFTTPYMADGGGILTKGGDPGPDLLNLYRPFPVTTWVLIGVAVVVTSLILYVITKAEQPRVFGVNPDQLPWTFEDCLIVIFGSLMYQGAERRPVTSAGRLLLGCWWLFAIVIVSTYTAMLAAILTVKVQPKGIDSIQDLAASDLNPTTIFGSNWWSSFMTAETGVYKTVGDRMKSAPKVKVNEDGLEVIHQGAGAYIMDVSTIRYLYGQDCKNLHMAASIFSPNGLGFVVPKNAYYKEAMNGILLKLREGGFLKRWEQRFWQTTSECDSDASGVSGAERLEVVSLGGILILYALVILLALLCLAAEAALRGRRCVGWRRRWRLRWAARAAEPGCDDE